MEDKKYVIKKNKVDPFQPHDKGAFFIGYLSDFDEHTLVYKLTKSIFEAHTFNLYDGALAVAKLNKLNMLFYEICTIDEID